MGILTRGCFPMNERELFIAALRIANEGERSAYLDQSCADDPVLRKRIEALLRAHFESDDRLERPLVDQVITDVTIGSASGYPVTLSTAEGTLRSPQRGPASGHGDRRVSRRREAKCA